MIDTRYELGPSSNIFSAVLPEGIYYPEYVSLEDERPHEFVAYYNAVRRKPWRDCTILDLGCGEGTSSTAIGRTGARVIGVDGRPEVVRRAEYLRDRLGYANVEFRVGNVLDPAQFDDVDAVFASGLIHHVATPFDLMQLIGRHTREFAYFCTHCAPDDEAERAQSFFASLLFEPGTVTFAGRPLPGVKFFEGLDVREDRGPQRRHPRAGVGNQFSWWPTQESFTAAMAAVGFPHARTITSHAHRLRHRLCFARGAPIDAPRLDPDTYTLPAPARPPLHDAAERAQAADLAFLKAADVAPALVGVGRALLVILGLLAKHAIRPGRIYLPDGVDAVPVVTFARRLSLNVEIHRARNLPAHKPAYAIIACDDFVLLRQYYSLLMNFTFCKYAFTSFSLLATGKFPELQHPVTGDVLPRRDDPVMNY